MRATVLQERMAPGSRSQRIGRLGLILATICAWLTLLTSPASAGDPRRVWKTIETDHFIIHYFEPNGDVAVKVARSAERSHAILVPVFQHLPEAKTQVILLDQTDGSNGFASVLPFNRITLYATAPESDSVLNDHDDWLFYLTAHEYAHILHLDTIGGLAKWVNKIVGKSWAPNQIMPRWIIEGLATHQETKHTSGGRGRSSLFDMNLRVAVLADQHLRLDQVTNGPRYWPRGTVAYLHGSHFLQYIFDRYGDDKIPELAKRYGYDPIPYSFNRIMGDMVGKDMNELYDDWTEFLRSKYSLQVEAAERIGLRTGRRLTFSRESNTLPRYTRDGQHILWQISDGFSPGHIRAMPVGGNVGESRKYTDINRLVSYEPLADGSLVAAVRNNYRTNYTFDDLYRWHRKERRLERLTHGLRAKAPTVSPDERQVAFIITANSRSRLAVMPLQPQSEHRILWQGERFDQASSPRWSPDGRSIALSTWAKGGYRDIRIIDVASGRERRLTNDRAIDIYPVFSPDGAYLYYSSDRSGIYNIYAYDLRTEKTWQVTNVLGGTFNHDISPDSKRLVYMGFGVGGYDLYEIDLDPNDWLVPAPYINDRPDPAHLPEDIEISKPRPYRPLTTLAPRAYTAGLVATSFGTGLTIQTAGADVVGLHRYTLGTTIDLTRGDINLGMSYNYNNEWPNIRVSASRSIARRSGLIIDNRNTSFIQETYSLTAGVGLPMLRSLLGTSQLNLDYDFDWFRNLEDQYDGPDPNDILPQFPEVDMVLSGLALRWSYNDTEAPFYLMGQSRGNILSASLRMDHPVLGSKYRTMSVNYSWQGFLRVPWIPWSTFAVRINGATATTNRARQSVFSLGGIPDQDIATAIIENRRASASGHLRGFPRRVATGNQYHLANLEYRQFLFAIERGVSTLPFYLRQVHIAGLLDVGNAYDKFDITDVRVGAGAALRMDFAFGYYLVASLDLGYARGLTADGTGEYWFLLTGAL